MRKIILTVLLLVSIVTETIAYIECESIDRQNMCGWDSGQPLVGDIKGRNEIIDFVNSSYIDNEYYALETLSYDNEEISKSFRFIESNNKYTASSGSHYGVLQWSNSEGKRIVKKVHKDPRFTHLKKKWWSKRWTNKKLQDAMVTITLEEYREAEMLTGQPMFDAYIRHLLGNKGGEIFYNTYFNNVELEDVLTDSGYVRKRTMLKRIFNNLGAKAKKRFGRKVWIGGGRYKYVLDAKNMSDTKIHELCDALFKRIIIKLNKVA